MITFMTYWLWHSTLFDVVFHFLSATSDWKTVKIEGWTHFRNQPPNKILSDCIFLTPDLWLYWWCTIIIFFPPHYGPGVDSATNGNEYYKYFLRVKGSQCTGLTTLPPTCADCLEIWDHQPPWTLYRDCSTLLYYKNTLLAAVAGSSYIVINIIQIHIMC